MAVSIRIHRQVTKSLPGSLVMPGKDGEALGREIKADKTLRDTILVMLTSIGRQAYASSLEEIGFSACLTKPVRQSQLYDCLVTVLAGKQRPVAASHRPVAGRTSWGPGKRKVRIFLAEDNVVNQKVALKILERLGYRADAVADGQEVITALETTPYDLVLMDVQMPEMDGLEATREIRNPRSE